MECKSIMILVIVVISFRKISSQETEYRYVMWGSEKVRSILEVENVDTSYLNGTVTLGTIAQNFANEWGRLRANKKGNLDTKPLEAPGLNAIFADRDNKTDNKTKFTKKFEKAMATKILNVAKARQENGQFLMEIGIGYIEEKLKSWEIHRRVPNYFGATSVLHVHLLTVLRFTRDTPTHISASLKKTLRDDVLLGVFADRKTVNFNTPAGKEAELWASKYADKRVQPNIKSTPKDFWITCLSCTVENANYFVREFFEDNSKFFQGDVPVSFAWIQSVEYKYDPSVHQIQVQKLNDQRGYFVLVTKFPECFTSEEQDALVRRIPGLSTQKHCPKAANTACKTSVTLSPIGNETSEIDDKPVLVSQDDSTIIFNFPVQTGMFGKIPQRNAGEIPQAHFAFIAKQISKLDKSIVGAGFGRLLERNVENNEIKSITTLVLLLDPSQKSPAAKISRSKPKNGDTLSQNSLAVMNYKLTDLMEDSGNSTRENKWELIENKVAEFFEFKEEMNPRDMEAARKRVVTDIRNVCEERFFQRLDLYTAGSEYDSPNSPIESEANSKIFAVYESKTITSEKTFQETLNIIEFGFFCNQQFITLEPLLNQMERYDKTKELDVKISGYCIRACQIPTQKNAYKVFLVLAVQKGIQTVT